MTEQRKQKFKRMFQESRIRLIEQYDGFALPLRDMLFVATKEVERISTNGSCIYFNPEWLKNLGRRELDFMLSHQLMHISLGHINRHRYYKGDRFHLACDIVANSNLSAYGWTEEKLPHIGKIYTKTFFPQVEGRTLTAEEAHYCVPFDPAALKKGVRRNYMIDSEYGWDMKHDRGENGIIVLSPKDSDPDNVTCEEEPENNCRLIIMKGIAPSLETVEVDEGETLSEPLKEITWDESSMPKMRSLREVKSHDARLSTLEGNLAREWLCIRQAKINWRKLLNDFIQQELYDYSFMPPDRRLQDADFFLPDYNVSRQNVKDILFMVDTSASVDDKNLSAVYGEIISALSQFDGGLNGWLGFFDTRVYPLIKIQSMDDIILAEPKGMGGTDFGCVFKYVAERITATPAGIVIFTDGNGAIPPVEASNNIPVMWIINNKISTPDWGTVARI